MGLKFIMHGAAKDLFNKNISNSLYETYTATEGQTVFKLNGSYRVGANELNVYLNGVKKIMGVDYIEVDERTVEFLRPLSAGDIAHFNIQSVDTSSASLHQEFIATEGQTTFLLEKAYRQGMNTLNVYYNGVLQHIGDDYIELTQTSVEFNEPLPAGSKITFKETL